MGRRRQRLANRRLRLGRPAAALAAGPRRRPGRIFLFGIAVAGSYDWARNADHRAQIARLTRECDQAHAEAEARVTRREQAAQEAQARAEQLRLAALQAEQQAHTQAQTAAAHAEHYRLRARNAICAAARIKRKATQSVP
ncbi:hypothetical protein ACE0DR_26220 [Azotobacter sp. CWF10]